MSNDIFWSDDAFPSDFFSEDASSGDSFSGPQHYSSDSHHASVIEHQLVEIEELLEQQNYYQAWKRLSSVLAGQPELMSQATREQYADLWGTLGITVGLDGNLQESLTILRRAIAEHRAAEDEVGEMIDWLNLGEMQTRLGDGASAVVSLTEARRMAMTTSHQPGLEKANLLLTNARRLSLINGFGQHRN